jgi:hypothetical protein
VKRGDGQQYKKYWFDKLMKEYDAYTGPRNKVNVTTATPAPAAAAAAAAASTSVQMHTMCCGGEAAWGRPPTVCVAVHDATADGDYTPVPAPPRAAGTGLAGGIVCVVRRKPHAVMARLEQRMQEHAMVRGERQQAAESDGNLGLIGAHRHATRIAAAAAEGVREDASETHDCMPREQPRRRRCPCTHGGERCVNDAREEYGGVCAGCANAGGCTCDCDSCGGPDGEDETAGMHLLIPTALVPQGGQHGGSGKAACRRKMSDPLKHVDDGPTTSCASKSMVRSDGGCSCRMCEQFETLCDIVPAIVTGADGKQYCIHCAPPAYATDSNDVEYNGTCHCACGPCWGAKARDDERSRNSCVAARAADST